MNTLYTKVAHRQEDIHYLKAQPNSVNYLDFGSWCSSVETHDVKREKETTKKKTNNNNGGTESEKNSDRNKGDSDSDRENNPVCTSMDNATDKQ